MKASSLFNGIVAVVVSIALISAGFWVNKWLEESRILRQVIERLSAETRVAEVLVTKSEYDEQTQKIATTIKFLEYGPKGNPLKPKYFTFHGNIIQFQSLVIRFEDELVRGADRLKGKSAYLFLKAFVLNGDETEVFEITPVDSVPGGYRVGDGVSEFEKELWQNFWDYALKPDHRDQMGVKNAQIEAPGSIFVPGTIYTLKIEHDGGLRIDARPVPEILKGEKV